MEQENFGIKEQSKVCNVMTADNCQNIMSALEYVTDAPQILTPQKINYIKEYISEQVTQWSEKLNGKFTAQDIMYGLIRSHVILRGEGNEMEPVDVRYAVEHPMRISQMHYGVCAGDEKAVKRADFLIDMLFDDDGKGAYETQRLFLSALADKLIQSEHGENQTSQSMIKVLLNGMKRSAKACDAWSEYPYDLTGDAKCSLASQPENSPRLVATNQASIAHEILQRKRS